MNVETKGLGAGSYPEPKEEKLVRAKGMVIVRYTFDEEFPNNYTQEDIEDYIEHNTRNFDEYDVNIEEISIEEE